MILRTVSSAAALGIVLLLGVGAQAATLTLGLDTEFSGGQEPAGTAPWITAVFDDATGDPSSVLLTMSATGLVGGKNGELMALMHFNLDPVLDPTLLSFVVVDAGSVGTTVVNTGVDGFKADGDGLYDIQFDFPPPPGTPAGRFTEGKSMIYEIFYSGGIIDASSFDFLSTPDGGAGVFLAAAHVQNTTGAGTGGSGWIGVVPEPATGVLLGLGLLGLASVRRPRQ
jgi:hypothetical protein